MKSEMSSFDVFAIVRELQLKEARINKIFQVSEQEIKIHLSAKNLGKKELVIEAGKRIHLTEHPKPSPEKPSAFAMLLRKHLENATIKELKQVGFDRIVEIKCEREKETVLIAELFGKGNILLADSGYNIIGAMRFEHYRDRKLIPKVKYEYPPQKLNPFELSESDLLKVINESGLEMVKTLASSLSLGGLYAEELCLRSGLDKNKREILPEEAKLLFNSLCELLNFKKAPVIIFENDKPVDAVPFKLKFYEGKKSIEFENFNKALDEYFTKYESEKIKSLSRQKFEKEIQKLKARLKEQEETLEKHETIEREYRKFGDLIYANFNVVADILKRKNLSKDGTLLIELQGTEVKLYVKKTVSQNANFYYTKSKKSREKIEGVKAAIAETQARIAELEKRGKEVLEVEDKDKDKKPAKRKKEWYEKFRWFISTDGFLVLGGRDAASNEVLVKRHMHSSDIFVHADIHGAPVVVIKTEGRKVPEQTIQEAFDFAASYSKAWKHNIAAIDVYWVMPEQVSKTAEHGEYIPKGAFVIRGKKNFGKGKTEIAIGVKINETVKVIGGVASAIEKHSDYFVKIIPGRKSSPEIAQEIKTKLTEKAQVEDKQKIPAVALEEIQEFLPGGGSEVVRE